MADISAGEKKQSDMNLHHSTDVCHGQMKSPTDPCDWQSVELT
jgi:hypothetical protein